MRIAFTSTDGQRVDEHFGQATHFHVWEVDADRAEPVAIVGAFGAQRRAEGPGAPASSPPDDDDRIAARAEAIAGCTLVYTMQIGGPAAARLVARRICPMKTGVEVPIAEAVEKLQQVLRGRPPPWLRRALGTLPAADPEPDPEDA
jgi:nitrogen fixation protein NifX